MPKLSLTKLERHLYSAADRLRQEGLDAATYKDYIFGMLFLKRCSDVWQTEHDALMARKVAQGCSPESAEADYGENPDYYDSFFVPERARWSYLQSKLSDAAEPYGSVLDKALGGLSEHNESLEHVLDHIQFMRVQSNKRIASDDACKDLVRHFGRYRLRNEDFQFSDLLGAAYEFLINMFAESAGKKGGDFYTPRDVIRLMVRLLRPAPGMSIYDPTCGSGGMLIISREYIDQSGGDPLDLRLCGQVNDASAWSICKLNMLLHGVPDADIRLEDIRLVLEECGIGRQLTDQQRKAAIKTTLDMVERIRQEIAAVGFWKNPHAREMLTRRLVRDLDGSGICRRGTERPLAQQLVALAKENHENLVRA